MSSRLCKESIAVISWCASGRGLVETTTSRVTIPNRYNSPAGPNMQEPTAKLNILIANIAMIRRTGTQMFVRDLCLGLQAAGHRPMIYSPELGEIAAEIAASGVPVVDDLSKLPAEPDIIHSNQHSEGLEAFLHFPKVWNVSVCHDATSRFNIPLLTPYMGHYVAVDDLCYERLHKTYKIPEHRIRVIYN